MYQQWNDSVALRIDSLLEDDMFNSSQVGICIYDLTRDVTLYSCNERQTMRPASTQKLITAITALDILGTDHHIYTTIRHTGDVNGHTLEGDLYCIGNFDPMLSSSNIDELAQGIKGYGIDSIRGNIYIDKSMKDNLKFGSGWCWDDENPVLSPITVDRKDDFHDCFVNALSSTGVTFIGQVGLETCPPETKIICSTFHKFEHILPRILKNSDNFYAEAMFYNLAASAGKVWAGANDAAIIIEKLAETLNHDKSEFRIADGSGLSLYNYTTPEIEVDFLRYAYGKRDIFCAIYNALPIAGVDGTLKKRMKDYTNTMGNVRAKTGSVSCISSLAGYCKASNGNDIAFCIINQGILQSKKARKFQDKVCAILCETLNTKLD